MITCLLLAGLGGVFALTQWDRASRIATVVSALAAVAAVGVAVWAAPPRSGATVRVSNTGEAIAGVGGRANSGLTGRVGELKGPVEVEATGRADASNGGEADSGMRLTELARTQRWR